LIIKIQLTIKFNKINIIYQNTINFIKNDK